MSRFFMTFFFLALFGAFAQDDEFVPEWKKNLRAFHKELAEKRQKLKEKLLLSPDQIVEKTVEATKNLGEKTQNLTKQLRDNSGILSWDALQEQKGFLEKMLRQLQLQKIEQEQNMLQKMKEAEKSLGEEKIKLKQQWEATQKELHEKQQAIENEIQEIQHELEVNWAGFTKTTDEVWIVDYGDFFVTFFGIALDKNEPKKRSYTQPLQELPSFSENVFSDELSKRWNRALIRIKERLYTHLPDLANIKKIGSLGTEGSIHLYNTASPLNAVYGVYKDNGSFQTLKMFDGDADARHHGGGFLGSSFRIEGQIPEGQKQGTGKLVYTLTVTLGKKQEQPMIVTIDIWVPLTFISQNHGKR